MRRNILAKRILCFLAAGGICCGAAFPTAYAEDITIDNQNKITGGSYFDQSYKRISPSDKSGNTLTFSGTLNFEVYTLNSIGATSVYGGYADDATAVKGNTVHFAGGTFTNLGGIFGGYSKEGNAENNKVVIDNNSEITSNYSSFSISGGYSGSGSASNNTVEIKDGSSVTTSNIYGGSSALDNSAAHVSGNKVIISGSSTVKATEIIYGGRTTYGEAHDNTVEISDSSVESSDGIYGGYNGSYSYSDVTDNHVKITNSHVTANNIYGGYLWDEITPKRNSSASNNDIYIKGSEITGDLYANYNRGNGISENGAVTIEDSKISGSVYANYNADAGSGTGENGTVTVKGTSDISNASLYGSNKDTGSGNRLILDDWSGSVKVANNFNSMDFDNIEWKSGGTVMTITGSDQSSLENTEININSFKDSSSIEENQSMTFIKTSDPSVNLNIDENKVTAEAFTAGVTGIGEGKVTVNGSSITYTVTELKVNP